MRETKAANCEFVPKFEDINYVHHNSIEKKPLVVRKSCKLFFLPSIFSKKQGPPS